MESTRTTKSSQSTESRYHGSLTRKASNLGASAETSNYGDMYRTNTSGYGSDNKRKQPSTEPDYEDSKWIDRDKLAQIERKELEEAGFRVPRKTMSRATSSRSSSRHRPEKYTESPQLESPVGDDINGAYALPHDKRQRTISPSRVEEEDLANGMNFELRTPEEVAAERDLMSKQGARPGTSRIPVKKMSPLPVPSTFIERDSPLPRSRGNSVGWTGRPEDLESPPDLPGEHGAAGHSQSAIDDEPSTPPATYSGSQSPAQRSPLKARVPSKANPTSGNRKTSSSTARKTSATTQSRNTSTSSPTKRPGTSSGRPSTSHQAPEGDPPWIANMYKPDPRLPPDQQMLPTHAKRLAQEQWEKEGKTGTVYDRDFRLLNDEQPVQRPERKSSLSHRLASKENLLEDETKKEEMPTWPLVPPIQKRTSAATSTGRPGTSGTDHGGYSIMPSLNSPKHPPGSPNPAVPSPKPIEVMRMQDPDSGPQFQEIEKKKSGCACCVVM